MFTTNPILISTPLMERPNDTLITNKDPQLCTGTCLFEDHHQRLEGIIDEYTKQVILAINYCIVSTAINLGGTVTNIINIVVFIKQGFADRMNISLMGLAISDLGCLLTLQWMNLCFNPLFRFSPKIPFDSLEVQYITGGWPHACFARTTGLITAYITAERCLCIAAPLKVKTILTHKRTTFVIVIIFVLMFGSTAPIYSVNLLGPKFYPGDPPVWNRTLIGLVFTENRDQVEQITFALNNVFGYIAFLLVTIFTSVLVSKLRKNVRWRRDNAKSAISGGKQDVNALRDARVIKMVTSISTIFIVCFFPVTIIFIGIMAVPGLGLVGRYSNMFHVTCSFGFALETINSSVNLFVYLKMSSKFKATFDSVFRKRTLSNATV
ncbi:growth hormone secretagogue receptor type 1 [Elysia marginata]|uniref:Growth hormone secretagogue receptor type 1 n=1 Tax=Elysia marginata TaxID=1093978 RepID=A0AAV4I8S5_9GAST|nr:growth hormone secretagogue receptor type 1 [Elysia marginata]